MAEQRKALIVVENSFVPLDTRVRQEATSLRDAGWTVNIVCPAPSGVYTVPPADEHGAVDLEGIRVFYFPLRSANNGLVAYAREYVSAFLSISRLCWRIWRQGHFQILHICNPPDFFFPIMLLYRLLGAAVIYDHHDLFPEFARSRFRGAAGKMLALTGVVMEYLSCQFAHVTVAVNESYRDIAIQRARVSPRRTVIVRNGPRIAEFSNMPPVPALKRGYRFLVCYIGIMGHDDGIPQMLGAIRYVVQDLGRRDICFHLMGDGALRMWAQRQISDWGLNDCVQLPGMMKDRTAIRQYLSTADLCLSPEPLSPLNALSTFIKVGEYMAMGKPVIAFDLKETRFTAREAAFYVPPGNTKAFGRAISDLLDAPDRRAEMGRCGRKRFLERLAWEHQEQYLLVAYERALRMARSVHSQTRSTITTSTQGQA